MFRTLKERRKAIDAAIRQTRELRPMLKENLGYDENKEGMKMIKTVSPISRRNERSKEIQRLIREADGAIYEFEGPLGIKFSRYIYRGIFSDIFDTAMSIIVLMLLIILLVIGFGATVTEIINLLNAGVWNVSNVIYGGFIIFAACFLSYLAIKAELEDKKKLKDTHPEGEFVYIRNTDEDLKRLQEGWAYWQSEIDHARVQ